MKKMNVIMNVVLLSVSLSASLAFADARCNIKAQEVAQSIAQANGLSGNLVESAYSAGNEFTVTVDKTQTYTVKTSDENGSCQIEQITLNH